LSFRQNGCPGLFGTSDSGGESEYATSTAPLRGGKSQLCEGGIHVPLIVRWPATVPAGAVCDTPTCNVDFSPTFLEAPGAESKTSQAVDGVSILPLLKDPKSRLKREAMYWHYPPAKPRFLGSRSNGAVRQGDSKLIEFLDTGEVELYNLADDVGERRSLA
jgi:arylsulfatase A